MRIGLLAHNGSVDPQRCLNEIASLGGSADCAVPPTGDAGALAEALYRDEEEHTIICRHMRAALAASGGSREPTQVQP